MTYLATYPCGGCQGQQLGAWYDEIVQTVGDVGADAVERIKARIQAKYGAELWNALPEATKQSAIASAWNDVQARAAASPLWIAGAAVALLLLLRRR